jgi:holin-like protein
MIRRAVGFVGQVVLLWAVLWLGNRIAAATGLPVPGNVVGVLLLFGLLLAGIVKLEQVQDAADFLLRHLVFFFIPVAVGLMNWGETFYRYGLVLAVAIVVGSLLPFWTVGLVSQRLHKRN